MYRTLEFNKSTHHASKYVASEQGYDSGTTFIFSLRFFHVRRFTWHSRFVFIVRRKFRGFGIFRYLLVHNVMLQSNRTGYIAWQSIQASFHHLNSNQCHQRNTGHWGSSGSGFPNSNFSFRTNCLSSSIVSRTSIRDAQNTENILSASTNSQLFGLVQNTVLATFGMDSYFFNLIKVSKDKIGVIHEISVKVCIGLVIFVGIHLNTRYILGLESKVF